MATAELPGLPPDIERKDLSDEKDEKGSLSISSSSPVDVWDDGTSDGRERPIGRTRS